MSGFSALPLAILGLALLMGGFLFLGFFIGGKNGALISGAIDIMSLGVFALMVAADQQDD